MVELSVRFVQFRIVEAETGIFQSFTLQVLLPNRFTLATFMTVSLREVQNVDVDVVGGRAWHAGRVVAISTSGCQQLDALSSTC